MEEEGVVVDRLCGDKEPLFHLSLQEGEEDPLSPTAEHPTTMGWMQSSLNQAVQADLGTLKMQERMEVMDVAHLEERAGILSWYEPNEIMRLVLLRVVNFKINTQFVQANPSGNIATIRYDGSGGFGGGGAGGNNASCCSGCNSIHTAGLFI